MLETVPFALQQRLRHTHSCAPVQAELASQAVSTTQLQQELQARLDAATQHSCRVTAELAEARDALSRWHTDCFCSIRLPGPLCQLKGPWGAHALEGQAI